MKITILYSCDSWHTTESRFLHGAFTSRDKAINSLTQLLATARSGKYPPLSEDDHRNLEVMGQTQGYAGEGEFMLADIPLDDIDTWL